LRHYQNHSMRLSSIKLAGFKSFVDPSTLPLPSNLTAVVGPNGCGKSNIIDAVRWVLGESSMKTLRSESMEDVIFNGSKSRKPAGRAMIELTFDNSDGTISGPYAAYNEVTVRRELTRDGNSQYYLNNARCLKRDVLDLFLGTGLAARSGYAIIEQGMVSNMIQAKPEELRQWIEEAAGISKYKERRRETETRIRQTRENLARLNDLRTELATRLETLRKQAANAEKYKEYKEQERKLRAESLALKLRALEQQGAAQESARAGLAQDFEAARAAVAQVHADQGRAEAAVRDANHVLAERQNAVYEAEGQLARQEQSLAHAREMKAMKARELEELDRQLGELDRREAADRAQLEELGATLAALEHRLQQAEADGASAQAAADDAERAGIEGQKRWDEFTLRAEAPLYQAEGERVRVHTLERALAQATERLERLRGELGALDAAPIQSSLFDADSELQTLDRELADGQARLQSLEHQIHALREQRASEDGALHEARAALQNARGRFASLETLQQAALRQDDAELQGWLAAQGLTQAPRLASALRVERGWEAAVEHVLDGLLQAPLLAGYAGRADALPAPPKAGIALMDDAGASSAAAGDRLAAKVHGPAVVADLLANIYVAPTHAEAVYRAGQLRPGESVIEPAGAWRGRGWVRYPRADDDRSGVLARSVLLEELGREIAAHTDAVRRHESALEQALAQLATLERERQDLASRFDSGRSRQAQRLAFRQAQAVRLEQTEQRVRALQQELDGLRAAQDQQRMELGGARTRLTELESVAQQLREERAQLQQALATQREQLNAARNALAQVLARRHQAELELAGRRSALEALQRAQAELAQRRAELVARRERDQQEALALEAPIGQQAGSIEAARAAVEREREQLRQAREQVEAAEGALAALAQKLREAEFAQDGVRERLQQAQIELQGLAVRRQTLADQVAEAGFELATLLEGLAADATAEAWEEKLGQMARRIDRLGAINLAAIQELDEGDAREKYLADQNNDLSGALDTLESAIRKIDAETKERFRTTFDQVNAIFRDRFPRLFGGGEAYLELTGEDLLETGVRVMARPPGKRNSSIQLLSGGEKAMTAVALLLALFQLNPAPFCMLDEVDAPLDDANVGRFVEVIREMAANVQFVIITHNKITMELAQQLHGVTMQEPGVSRLVSVDIQEAMDLAAKNESAVAAA
jgi:chromosome segregation protein